MTKYTCKMGKKTRVETLLRECRWMSITHLKLVCPVRKSILRSNKILKKLELLFIIINIMKT